jgi:glucose/arabinose dehydrogenase
MGHEQQHSVRRGGTLSALAAIMMVGAAQGAAALGTDQEVGQRFNLRPGDLPAPYATSSASNSSSAIARPPGAALKLPTGFTSGLFADGLGNARWLEVAPNGDVFLAESGNGRVTVLRDADRDGKAEVKSTFIEGMRQPHGMAFRPDGFYVADVEGVWRVPYQAGDLKARGAKVAVTAPNAFGGTSGHSTRGIVFSPDGQRFYVPIGSASNVSEDPSPRATIVEFSADGSKSRVFASGLRNAVGTAFRPGTNELWTVVNERDNLGDGLVPDYLTQVVDGGFYGWPYSYVGSNPDPRLSGKRPDLMATARVPDVLFTSHSAPLGLAFYTGSMFPVAYRGDAFVALHGSWNSGKPTGYKVVRVPFRDGKPAAGYENFATGFWASGENNAQVWGRPVGLAVAADGALLVADDTGRAVWRIAYQAR